VAKDSLSLLFLLLLPPTALEAQPATLRRLGFSPSFGFSFSSLAAELFVLFRDNLDVGRDGGLLLEEPDLECFLGVEYSSSDDVVESFLSLAFVGRRLELDAPLE